jgi:uncharacterized protein with HEPN domain
MRPEDRNTAYLWDMLDAARTAVQIKAESDLQSYLKNRTLQLAMERCLEIIGEAARRISADFKQSHPEIPWSVIIGQRNVIAHEYGDIRQDRLWQVATERLPEFINSLEKLMPSDLDASEE